MALYWVAGCQCSVPRLTIPWVAKCHCFVQWFSLHLTTEEGTFLGGRMSLLNTHVHRPLEESGGAILGSRMSLLIAEVHPLLRRVHVFTCITQNT